MLLRSVLITPGNNMRMIVKSLTLNVDAGVLDLEDSVPMADKETARIFIRDSIGTVKPEGSSLFVRVNGMTTGMVDEDLKYVVKKGLDGIMQPKSESKQDIIELDKLIEKYEKKEGLKIGSLKIIATFETAKGILNAYEIATASKRVIAVGFGAVDYTRDLGTTISKEGSELFYPRSHVAIVARATGVIPIDTVWIDIIDKEGLTKDANFSKQLGLKGKFLIHPNQIDVVNEVYSPKKSEVDYAGRVVKAFEEGASMGLGAVSLDGRMIDIAVYRQAQDLLNLANEIAKKK